MLRLAEKAFWPAKLPFPVMHIDTGHNFPEVIEFRDRRVAELGVRHRHRAFLNASGVTAGTDSSAPESSTRSALRGNR